MRNVVVNMVYLCTISPSSGLLRCNPLGRIIGYAQQSLTVDRCTTQRSVAIWV